MTSNQPPQWDLKKHFVAPRWEPAPGADQPGLTGFFFDGLPWQGKPTRVFGWLGLPKNSTGKKVPGMVLIHGGGGTAHVGWVRMWNERGYAAIAIDTCGKAYGTANHKGERHELSGPPGWDSSFDQIDQPIEDQWAYHAVGAALSAHSLLRSFPEVDTNHIGITGVSWGGYLTCIIAGVDPRYSFAAPVYGCGFIAEDSSWAARLRAMPVETSGKWSANWDPSVYLPNIKVPMLWVSGDRDHAYPLNSLQKSYLLPKTERHVCIKPGMVHDHDTGEQPQEIHAFADHLARGTPPLPRCIAQGVEGSRAWATFQSPADLQNARFTYTQDRTPWPKRTWEIVEAHKDADGRFSFDIPANTSAYYFAITDARDLNASSEHVELP